MKTTNFNIKGLLRKSSLALIVAVAFIATSCEEEMIEPMDNGMELVNTPSNLDEINGNQDYFIQGDIVKSGKQNVDSKNEGKGEVQRYNSNFKTLKEALKYTGLKEVVYENRYTVLAPTDEAFVQLFEDLGIESIYDLDPDDLAPILLYHVLPGTVLSNDLAGLGGSAATANGQNVTINLNDGVMFNDATVEAADIKAMNGVFHAIDKVLLPPSLNIVELAQSDEKFKILVQAVIAADLVGALASGEWTVFAPTNDAFVALLEGSDEWSALGDIPIQTLVDVLLYHVVPATVYSTNLIAGDQEVTSYGGGTFTVNGTNFTITDANGRVAQIGPADLMATNGVIHTIDTVILPKE